MAARMRDGIVKRGSRWAYKLELPRDPATGKRRQQWVSGFGTRKEAEADRDEARARVRRGTHVQPAKLTVGEYLHQWLNGIRVKPTTLAQYRQSADIYAIPHIGSLPLRALTAEHLDAMYRTLERSGRHDGKGLAPKSVRHVHTMLRKALQDATERGHVLRNVADLANPPTQKQAASRAAKDRVWTVDELRRFLDHVKDDRLFAAWLLLATTGMRRGEVAGLAWEHVDLDRGTLRIAQTVTVVSNALVWYDDAKTDAGARTVALDAATVTALRAHRARQLEERFAMGPAWRDDEHGPLVFCRADGSVTHPNRFTEALRRHGKACGLPPMNVHGLRHSYATAARRAGVDIEVLSERLGHADVAITLNLYRHVDEEDHQRAAAIAAEAILGSSGTAG